MQPEEQPTVTAKTIYRARGKQTVRASYSMELEAQEKLTLIRNAFQTRFPKDQYPSMSAVLEIVITRSYQDLLSNAEWLDEEVKIFQQKYQKRKEFSK